MLLGRYPQSEDHSDDADELQYQKMSFREFDLIIPEHVLRKSSTAVILLSNVQYVGDWKQCGPQESLLVVVNLRAVSPLAEVFAMSLPSQAPVPPQPLLAP